MPYATKAELPPAVKKLPSHAQEIYQKAFNAAFEQYKDRGDRREALAHATAWAAVKGQYKQVDDKWVAREATMPELRAEEIRGLLDAALTKRFGRPDNRVSIYDWDSREVIYKSDGRLHKAPYEIVEDKAVVLDSTEVVAKTDYKTVEALQAKFNELVAEQGRRNASSDATRIRKITVLCQELLSNEKPEESAIEEAIEEADNCLAILQEAPVVKTEDGVQYPKGAFAYVPDPESPSTWKLRLWEDLTKKVTRRQLGRAAAAFSPGGFRGQKVAIPSADMAAVKRKIRAEYRKLDVADEDIPRWVKESEVRDYVAESMCLVQEMAAADQITKGIVPVRFLAPGFNTDKSRFYAESAITDAAKIFEGVKMYADHPTDDDDKIRPERSIRDWVATLKNCKVSDKGNAVGEAHINAGWLKEKTEALFEQGDLAQLAVSILGIGTGVKEDIDGVKTTVVENIVKGRSVDFVTEPGAGGRAGLMESGAEAPLDVDLLDAASLKAQRPDLVEVIVREVEERLRTEVDTEMTEKKVEELEGQVATLTEERDGLKGKLEEAETAQAKAEAKAAIEKAVADAELPEAAKVRLLERFADVTDSNGLEDAIKAEAEYVSAIQESGKVKGMGGTKPNAEADKKALEESFKGLGLSEEGAAIAAAGR